MDFGRSRDPWESVAVAWCEAPLATFVETTDRTCERNDRIRAVHRLPFALGACRFARRWSVRTSRPARPRRAWAGLVDPVLDRLAVRRAAIALITSSIFHAPGPAPRRRWSSCRRSACSRKLLGRERSLSALARGLEPGSPSALRIPPLAWALAEGTGAGLVRRPGCPRSTRPGAGKPPEHRPPATARPGGKPSRSRINGMAKRRPRAMGAPLPGAANSSAFSTAGLKMS